MPTAAKHKGKKKQKARKKPSKSGKKRELFTAKTADKYELYQLAVQSPDVDVKFHARVFKKARCRRATSFREDFCGTALLCAEWVKQGDDYTAVGYDLDSEVLAWGRERNIEPLGEAAQRVTLVQEDVCGPAREKVDLRVAQNFSYCVFKTREQLLGYCRAALDSLGPEGVFVMDMHGGPEAIEEIDDEREIGHGVTYVWEQANYWPATGEYLCHITFKFKDGSKLKRCFTYDWRFWNMPETIDILLEAGFAKVNAYFEGTDEDGEGDGNFRKTKRGENDASWIAYLVAQK